MNSDQTMIILKEHVDREMPIYNPQVTMRMYQCSYCTGGCCVPAKTEVHRCVKCNVVYTHLCQGCAVNKQATSLCFRCNRRQHVCLSRCNNGCIKDEPVLCKCGVRAVYRKVTKSNQNYGRFFYVCNTCNFFVWKR